MTILILLKVDLVNDIDDLPEQDAIFHVVVIVLKSIADNNLAHRSIFVNLNGLKGWEQLSVHEVEKRIAGERLAVLVVDRPIAPTQFLRNDGGVFLVVKLPNLLFGVIHFQKENPYHLLNALGIAVDARIVAHDILQALYQVIQTHISFSPYAA